MAINFSIKVTKKITIKPDIIDKSVKEFQKKGPKLLLGDIKDTILRGNSPVKGFGRFTNYSESYSKQIKKGRVGGGKKLRPVNLKVTGEMLASLAYKLIPRGFKVYFGSDLAKIHSEEGAGKSKVIRKLMPKSGSREQLKESVTRRTKNLLRYILSKNLK